MTVDAAVAEGLALLVKKYGDEVRVSPWAQMGRRQPALYSLELCGGTHVSRTGDIGLIQNLAENGSAAGVRRLEALGSARAAIS